MAVSRLHIRIEDFYTMTPREFYFAIQDQADREGRLIELQIQSIWESARMIAFFQRNTQVKKPLKKFTQLIRLPWDSKYKKADEDMSVEAMKKALMTIHGASRKRRKNK